MVYEWFPKNVLCIPIIRLSWQMGSGIVHARWASNVCINTQDIRQQYFLLISSTKPGSVAFIIIRHLFPQGTLTVNDSKFDLSQAFMMLLASWYLFCSCPFICIIIIILLFCPGLLLPKKKRLSAQCYVICSKYLKLPDIWLPLLHLVINHQFVIYGCPAL